MDSLYEFHAQRRVIVAFDLYFITVCAMPPLHFLFIMCAISHHILHEIATFDVDVTQQRLCLIKPRHIHVLFWDTPAASAIQEQTCC